LILLVIAPLTGILIERIVARNLGDKAVSVTLVVTIGLFVLFVGLAQQIWKTDVGRSVAPFFGADSFTIGTFHLSYHQALTIVLSVVVAAILYVLLNRTRIGTAMRGVVDNRELLGLFGGAPSRISMFSWALGSSLAGLAGILLVSVVGVDPYQLTFLVIDAFAAAVVGRLTSLPMTFVGAMLIGFGQGYMSYLPQWQLLEGIRASLPTIVLFVVLIFLPQTRLRVGQIKGVLSAPVPTKMRTVQVGLTVIIGCAYLAAQFSNTNILRFGLGIAFAVVMLSLVVLSGYGGYVSMAQLSFMGVGAAVVCKLNTTNPLAIVLAVIVAGAVGALVALPVLRLTGLYLALATFAFAELMDRLLFQTNIMFGFGGLLNAKRPDIFGIHFTSTAAFTDLMIVVFVLIAAGLLALRRGPLGRILIAMRDSPIAAGTLGLNQRWYRVGIFSLSAAIAGLGGAFFAEVQGFASASDFQALYGLEFLLLAVIWGSTSMTGAFVAGISYMFLPVFRSTHPNLQGLIGLVIGGGAILIGRDPNGLSNYLFTGTRWVLAQIPLLNRLNGPGEPRPARVDSAQSSEVYSDAQVAVTHGVA
jgi:branched-chain amino acid transport system permease protein